MSYKLVTSTKASFISIYSTTIWTKENFIWTSSSIKPNDNNVAKKYHALIRVWESIIRSIEKLTNGSSNIKISKHKTRETIANMNKKLDHNVDSLKDLK